MGILSMLQKDPRCYTRDGLGILSAMGILSAKGWGAPGKWMGTYLCEWVIFGNELGTAWGETVRYGM